MNFDNIKVRDMLEISNYVGTNPYDCLAEIYDKLFDSNPFYENVSEAEIELFDSYVGTAENCAKALDIGCGTGYHTMLLLERGYQTTAIDISSPMLKVAKKNAGVIAVNAEYLQLDANSIGSLKGNYKVAICMGSTLNHLSCWEKLFFNLRTKLEPNGIFLFSFDNLFGIDTLFWLFKRQVSGYLVSERIERFIENFRAVIYSRIFKNDWYIRTPIGTFPLHLNYYSFSKIKRLLAQNGFTVERRVGVNLVTCFVSKILNSSTEVLVGNRGLDEIPGMILKLDRILGRLLPLLCANTILVCKRI